MRPHSREILELLWLVLFGYVSTPTQKQEYFDYIIIGGGTAGLTVASRLSEDPSLSVLVLEAGGTGINNTGISIPGLAGTTLGSDLDWKFSTVPQESANQRIVYYPRGKVLGGSSAINFMISTVADKGDYNAIENLGNPGWSWEEFQRGFKKAEQLIRRPEKDVKYVVAVDSKAHGTNGLVDNSFPKSIPAQFDPYFPATINVSLDGRSAQCTDPFDGDLEGAYVFPSAINAHSTRVTSATAYYFPIQSRSNLVVRTYSKVSKLITKKTDEYDVVGVEYSMIGRAVSRAWVKKEVILSAGSIGSPGILERSGIGNQTILSSLDIPIALNLPGVGSNLADHPAVLGTYPLRPDIVSSDDLSRNATFAAEQMALYQNTGTGLLSHPLSVLDYHSLKSFVTPDEILEGLQLLHHLPATLLPNQFNTIVDRITNGSVAEYVLLNFFFEENVPDANTSYISIVTALQHPLSRGSVHINSKDPSQAPIIDPRLLSHPFDEWLMVKAAKHARKIFAQPQYKPIIFDEQYPGPSVRSDEDWLQSIKSRVRTEYHPLGTCAMMPRNQSGVVDPHLKVYGTKNLRVVDASILPIQISAHPTMTVYAIAEKAAEMILESKNQEAI